MKLKKIASLMLAGVMAVSMLAGCSNEGNTPDNNEEDNQVVANGNAATYAADALSAELKEYITVKSSSTLDSWVKDIATDTSKLGSNDIKYDYVNIFKAQNTASIGHLQGLRTALKNKVVDSNVVYVDDINNDFNSEPTNNQNIRTSSIMYVMSGAMEEKAVVESVVDYLIKYVTWPDAIDVSNGDDDYPTNTYNFKYDVEISTMKVTNDSLNGESAWVVGIVVTQTAAKVTNVEA